MLQVIGLRRFANRVKGERDAEPQCPFANSAHNRATSAWITPSVVVQMTLASRQIIKPVAMIGLLSFVSTGALVVSLRRRLGFGRCA